MRRRIRPALLRWAVSVFCALVGALMLIAPHQFGGLSFAPLRPWITVWGAAFFLSGVSLVLTSAIGLRGPFAVVSCVGNGLALFVLALSFALTGGWTGVAVYTISGWRRCSARSPTSPATPARRASTCSCWRRRWPVSRTGWCCC